MSSTNCSDPYRLTRDRYRDTGSDRRAARAPRIPLHARSRAREPDVCRSTGSNRTSWSKPWASASGFSTGTINPVLPRITAASPASVAIQGTPQDIASTTTLGNDSLHEDRQATSSAPTLRYVVAGTKHVYRLFESTLMDHPHGCGILAVDVLAGQKEAHGRISSMDDTCGAKEGPVIFHRTEACHHTNENCLLIKFQFAANCESRGQVPGQK